MDDGNGQDPRIAQANALLGGHRYGSREHEDGYALLRAAADAPGAAWAQWLLGAYHLQVIQRPGAAAQAAHWLRRAADAGVPPAMERLADMALHGVGLAYAPASAGARLRTLAYQGHAPSAWQWAYLSGQPGVPDQGAAPASLALRACALGFPPAYYSLGLRVATGDGVPRDAALGRALLLRAADGGFPDASDAADACAADGRDAAMPLHARLKANLDAAQPLLAHLGRPGPVAADGVSAAVLRLEAHLLGAGIPAFVADAAGRACVAGASAPAAAPPVAWDWTIGRPRVGIARQLATREECAWLIHRGAAGMASPGQLRRAHDGNSDSEFEQFDGLVRPIRALETDAVLRMVMRRAGAGLEAAGLAASADRIEPPSIVRYGPGNAYAPHYDYFTEDQMALNRDHRGDLGGQRTATLLLYLRAPDAGGQTQYLRGGPTVTGERGMLVVHENTVDGAPDAASLHAGAAVLAGEKWLLRTTLREHPMYL